MTPRDERLRLPEEDGYKEGGRVKRKTKAKKGKKEKKPTKAKKRVRKATGKRARGEAMKYVPLGGALPTTGMSSTVFGAIQEPSYFRAVLPQQEYANIPDVLKTLKEGQESIMKELEKRKAQVEADKVFAQSLARKKEEPSPVPSGTVTPEMKYDIQPPPMIRPIATVLSPTLGRLQPMTIQRQESYTPPIMTPISEAIPARAIPADYKGSLSLLEAQTGQFGGYRGADETLPSQPAVSGEMMKPVDANKDVSQPSAFVPIGASQPESVGDSAERAGAVAIPAGYAVGPAGRLFKRPSVEETLSRSVSAPMRGYTIPGTAQRVLVIPRPVAAKERPPARSSEEARQRIEEELQQRVQQRKEEKTIKLPSTLAAKLKQLQKQKEEASKETL